MKNFIRVKFLLIMMLPVFFAGKAAAAFPARITIRLADAEAQTLENSPRLKAVVHSFRAARFKSIEAAAAMNPVLSLEGYYRYNTEVPEIDVPVPGAGPVKMGDNNNYSAGPFLRWTVWDSGRLKNSFLSLRSSALSRDYEAEAVRRQLLLACRKAYFQLVLAREQVSLLYDAMRLAETRYGDIKVSVKVGTKSRRDELSAHQDLLLRRQQLSRARSDMASALRSLSSLSGVTYSTGTCIPFIEAGKERVTGGILYPTVYVELDPIDRLLEQYGRYADSKIWSSHPDLEVFTELARSAEYASKSVYAGLWPAFNITASSTLNYPNGTKSESFIQNSAGIAVSMPLFDSGRPAKTVGEYDEIKQSQLSLRAQKKTDFIEIWNNANDTLASLAEQESINEKAVSEAEELAGIVYKSYQAGSATYVEVQNVNYRLLEAKINLAAIRVQKLMSFAVIASLADEE